MTACTIDGHGGGLVEAKERDPGSQSPSPTPDEREGVSPGSQEKLGAITSVQGLASEISRELAMGACTSSPATADHRAQQADKRAHEQQVPMTRTNNFCRLSPW